MDMTQGNTIQLYISMMEHIKQELGEIVGITNARQGQISPSSTSGNVQREVIQSSHTTEYYFAEHSDFKKRVLITGLETAKMAWANSGNRKLQFVLDDMSTKMITIDTEDLQSIDFDLYISNSANDAELIDNLKQLAQAGIQNDKINFSQLMDIWSSESISSVRRKIEKAEQDKQKRDESVQQQTQELQTQQIEAAKEEKQKDRQHQIDLEILKGDNAITLADLKYGLDHLNKGLDLDHDGIRDEVELEKEYIKNAGKAEESQKQRDHEAKEAEKDRNTKKEIERIKAKNKKIN